MGKKKEPKRKMPPLTKVHDLPKLPGLAYSDAGAPMLPEFREAPAVPDIRDYVQESDAALEEWGMRRLQPHFEQQRDAMQAQLVSRGLMPGSEGFDRAIRQLSRAEGDAIAGLMLRGRAAEREMALAQAEQQLQRDMANWGMLYTHGMTPYMAQLERDLAMLDSETARHIQGLTGHQKAAVQAQKEAGASGRGFMEGMFGLGSTLITGAFGLSDPRFKKNARVVGTGHKGLPIYEYRLGNRTERGYMADEVLEVEPDAVLHGPGGYMMLDYAKLGGRPDEHVS